MNDLRRRLLQRQQFVGAQVAFVVARRRAREDRLVHVAHDPSGQRRAASGLGAGTRRAAGCGRLARQPVRSSRFSRIRLPPCASAICRLSTRPMPEPPGLVVKNGTNRLPVFDSPGPFVLDPQLHRRRRRARQPLPADADAAAGLAHRVDGVANQVDQQLLELIAVALDGDARSPARPGCGAPSRA